MIKNTKYIPEKIGEIFHIIVMEWFKDWQKYTLQGKEQNLTEIKEIDIANNESSTVTSNFSDT